MYKIPHLINGVDINVKPTKMDWICEFLSSTASLETPWHFGWLCTIVLEINSVISYLLIPFLEIFGTSFSDILVNFHVEVNNNNQWQCSHEYQTCPIGDGRIGDVSSQISHTEIVFTLFGCHNAELEKFGNIDQNWY